MVASTQITPGMTISVGNKLYRVESSVKVTVPKGAPFIKTRLRDLSTSEVVEKNFKLDQSIKDVSFAERLLEYLYLEGKDHLFLDVNTLDQITISAGVIGNKINYLKEGTELKATFYGDSIYTVELPQFLEIMIVKTEGGGGKAPVANATKIAFLETGAKIEVPPFVEVGDIIKVDTKTDEYIQRV